MYPVNLYRPVQHIGLCCFYYFLCLLYCFCMTVYLEFQDIRGCSRRRCGASLFLFHTSWINFLFSAAQQAPTSEARPAKCTRGCGLGTGGEKNKNKIPRKFKHKTGAAGSQNALGSINKPAGCECLGSVSGYDGVHQPESSKDFYGSESKTAIDESQISICAL